MKTLKQKQLEFLEETIKHFNLRNLGIKNSNCSYEAGCAIGRHIKDKNLCKRLDNLYNSSVDKYNVFGSLPKNLRFLTKSFLIAVQKLHDSAPNWNAEGLSEKGKRRVHNIKLDFDL